MRTYTAQVIACESYMGDPTDKLIWHFTVEARTPADAEAMMRRAPHPTQPGTLVPPGAAMTIYPGRLLG